MDAPPDLEFISHFSQNQVENTGWNKFQSKLVWTAFYTSNGIHSQFHLEIMYFCIMWTLHLILSSSVTFLSYFSQNQVENTGWNKFQSKLVWTAFYTSSIEFLLFKQKRLPRSDFLHNDNFLLWECIKSVWFVCLPICLSVSALTVEPFAYRRMLCYECILTKNWNTCSMGFFPSKSINQIMGPSNFTP